MQLSVKVKDSMGLGAQLCWQASLDAITQGICTHSSISGPGKKGICEQSKQTCTGTSCSMEHAA